MTHSYGSACSMPSCHPCQMGTDHQSQFVTPLTLSPSGLTAFSSLMYASFGFSTLEVVLVDIPRSVVSLIIFLCVALYLRKVSDRRLYIMAGACVPPFIGLLALSLLPNTDAYKWTKWGMYLMTVPYVLSLFLSWTLSKQSTFPHHVLPQTDSNHQSNPTSPAAQRKPSSPAPPSSATAWATCAVRKFFARKTSQRTRRAPLVPALVSASNSRSSWPGEATTCGKIDAERSGRRRAG